MSKNLVNTLMHRDNSKSNNLFEHYLINWRNSVVNERKVGKKHNIPLVCDRIFAFFARNGLFSPLIRSIHLCITKLAPNITIWV